MQCIFALIVAKYICNLRYIWYIYPFAPLVIIFFKDMHECSAHTLSKVSPITLLFHLFPKEMTLDSVLHASYNNRYVCRILKLSSLYLNIATKFKEYYPADLFHWGEILHFLRLYLELCCLLDKNLGRCTSINTGWSTDLDWLLLLYIVNL